MSALSSEATRLSQIVGNAADIGIQLSGKVRQLDVAKVSKINLFLLFLKESGTKR